MTNNNNVNNSSGFSRRSVFDTTPQLNKTGFSVSSTYITVPQSGNYLIGVNCFYDNNGDSRTNPGFSIEINNSRQPEISASAYARDTTHQRTSSCLNAIYSLNAGDEVSLTFRQEGQGTGTVTLQGNNSSIFLYLLE